MCTVWPSQSKALRKENNESASNSGSSFNIPPQKLFRWSRRLVLWATGDWQFYHNIVPTHASHLVQFFWQNIKSPRWFNLHYSPDLVPCDWLFPKLKSPLKGKRFQTFDEIQENMTGQLMVIRTVWGPQVPTLKGTEVSLSYVQCFLYLVSLSINASVFHSKWMDIVLDRPRYDNWMCSCTDKNQTN